MYRYKSVRLLRRVRGYKVYFFLTNVLAIFILLGTKVGNVFMDHPVYGYLIFAGGLISDLCKTGNQQYSAVSILAADRDRL